MTDPSSADLLGPNSKNISENKNERVTSNKFNKVSNDNDTHQNSNNANNITGNNNGSINNFIMAGNINSNSGTNLNNLANRRDSSLIYPPIQRSNQRNDSINAMFNTFNLPRFSTDASIAPFLNIADGTNGSVTMINNEHGPHINDSTKRRSQDLSQIARGYSIVNNNMWTPPTSQHNIPHISNPLQTKIANNHIDPLDVNSAPKFKPLSFSAGKLSSVNNEKNRADSMSIPPSNRGSTVLPIDGTDMDILHTQSNKRGSIPINMKPPTILPASNANNNGATIPPKFQNQNFIRNTNGSNVVNNIANNFAPGANNINQNLGLDSFFSGNNSRKNSLKLGTDDFDFDMRRRNSSIKLLLDVNNQPVSSPLSNQMVQHNGPIPRDIQKPPFPADVATLPSSLSRFSSMMNFIGNEQTGPNGIPINRDIIVNNPNMIPQGQSIGSINGIQTTGDVVKQEQLVMNSGSDIGGRDLANNKKRTAKTNKTKKQPKKRKQKSPSNGNGSLVPENYSDNNNTKKPKRKGNEKKIDKKSSFEDVLKKITKNHGIDKTVAEENLLKESEKKARDLLGVTKIDELMLMIDARKKGVTEKVETTKDGKLVIGSNSDILPPSNEIVGGVEKPVGSHGVKQHECKICHRFFTQLTHLEVHIRSHIGYKPFECQYCKKRFTQGGNLRTHLRLHTGEKPYECEICSKRFSRKGNLAAHVLTHQKLRPFVCRLDNCYKTFTQLGNMKAHQNRFHLSALSKLTERLAKLDPNEIIAPEERDMLEYFASLYKNSNKGIKGRGRDRSSSSSPIKEKETTIIEEKPVNSSISPAYRLYQPNPVDQQQQIQQQQSSMNNRIPSEDNLQNNIPGSINMDFTNHVVNVGDPQIQGGSNIRDIPMDSNFLQNDQPNGQLLDENGVDFKFVNYKK
ncbi:similar to Kazachstania africana KAFR_0B04580 hypothetical protein [Maudiozyma saulgeensis]|uniref:C2H2-type domain-containing protein n=1 Tax=Maudiozyma saulgeensis TaxID=1789683 RepID=A0A1X7QYS4_9SACH|nr:similar to Kazachstania africana KAFR_0B04580 hypothetical protein [Kazachstania saulgeensis]